MISDYHDTRFKTGYDSIKTPQNDYSEDKCH